MWTSFYLTMFGTNNLVSLVYFAVFLSSFFRAGISDCNGIAVLILSLLDDVSHNHVWSLSDWCSSSMILWHDHGLGVCRCHYNSLRVQDMRKARSRPRCRVLVPCVLKICSNFSLLTRAIMLDWPLGFCWVSLLAIECSCSQPDLSNSFLCSLLANNTLCGV